MGGVVDLHHTIALVVNGILVGVCEVRQINLPLVVVVMTVALPLMGTSPRQYTFVSITFSTRLGKLLLSRTIGACPPGPSVLPRRNFSNVRPVGGENHRPWSTKTTYK